MIDLSTLVKGKAKKPPRIVVYGPHGIGKSTFANDARAIILPTEDGLGEIDLATGPSMGVEPALANAIGRLAQMRSDSAALRRGSYTQLHVAAEQLGFIRELDGETVVVLLNASDQPVELAVPAPRPGEWRDLLNGDTVGVSDGVLRAQIPASWGRVLAAS